MVCTSWSTGPSLGAVEALTVRVVTRRSRPYNRRFTATVRSPISKTYTFYRHFIFYQPFSSKIWPCLSLLNFPNPDEAHKMTRRGCIMREGQGVCEKKIQHMTLYFLFKVNQDPPPLPPLPN